MSGLWVWIIFEAWVIAGLSYALHWKIGDLNAYRTSYARLMEKYLVETACDRFHHGEPCRPGDNHPGVA